MMAGEMQKSALMAVDEVNQGDAFDFTFTPHLRDPAAWSPPIIRRATISSAKNKFIISSAAIRRHRASRLFPSSNAPSVCSGIRHDTKGSKAATTSSMSGRRPTSTSCHWFGICWITSPATCFCIGSNYVWTWEMNRVIREIVTNAGGRILAERLLELGETTVDHIVREIIDEGRRSCSTRWSENPVTPSCAPPYGDGARRFFDSHAQLQPVRAGAQADRISRLGRMHHVVCLFRKHRAAENRAFVCPMESPSRRHSNPSVDGQSTYVCVMLLAAPSARGFGRCRRSASRRGKSSLRFPQGPIWVDPITITVS